MTHKKRIALFMPLLITILLAGCGEKRHNEKFLENVEEGNTEAVSKLISKGADVNTDNGKALSHAVESNQPEMCKILLDAGANPNVETTSGIPILERAVRREYFYMDNLDSYNAFLCIISTEIEDDGYIHWKLLVFSDNEFEAELLERVPYQIAMDQYLGCQELEEGISWKFKGSVIAYDEEETVFFCSSAHKENGQWVMADWHVESSES